MTRLVGADKATYHVHLSLLCNASSYFKAAFAEGRFQEGETRKIELPEDDASAVGGLVQWLYKQSFPLASWNTRKTANERFHQLARLNTLADKYDIPALTNAIIDRLWDVHPDRATTLRPKAPETALISYLYENTNERSIFRKFVVYWYAWNIDLKWFDKVETKDLLLEIPHEFAIDLAMAQGQRFACPHRRNPFALNKLASLKVVTTKVSRKRKASSALESDA